MDPTYKKGTGRLATDRYDFQSHVDGTDFRQNANTIDLSPPVTVGISNKNTVQEAVEALAAIAYPPTLSDATTTSKGVIKLDGDLGGGIVGTADLPRVTGLYGKTISSSVGAALNTGTILFWDGSVWTPTRIGQVHLGQIQQLEEIFLVQFLPYLLIKLVEEVWIFLLLLYWVTY